MPNITINTDVSLKKSLSKLYLIVAPEYLINGYYRLDKYGNQIDRDELVSIIFDCPRFKEWLEKNIGQAMFYQIRSRSDKELLSIVKNCLEKISNYKEVKKKIDSLVIKERELEKIRRRQNSIALAKLEIARLKKALAKAKKIGLK